MKPAAAAAINPAGKPAGVNRLLAGDVRGDFSHHVRWGAARHPGASPGPRRLSHRRSTPIFPLTGTAPRAGRCFAGVFPGTGSLSAGTEVGGSRDVFRRFFLSIAQSFR